ncbi:MAG TPA: PilZ domain-containing protein, partial [Polyangia bacterium]|nr:PilZ domain-containing protein [Polyangia bacterium]
MSAWLGRRTEPRVDFREAVRVIWPGEVSGVLARAVNLSSSGILVDAPTPTPCPVGSDVLCDVTLPRGPRLLRGRVAHRRLLASEKVGMGIEFVDLSPREAAELRDVVDDSAARPQRVKVRFRGTEHVVSARALATPDGFRLSTALPFLKLDTEVDVLISPDASVSARGRVARVALESGGAAPRLLIDVRVDDDPARTPVVQSLLEAVPEHVWEPEELGATAEPLADPGAADAAETADAMAGAIPSPADPDLTEIVSLEAPRSKWRALGGGMVAGAIAFSAFVAAIVIMRAAAPKLAPPPSLAPPVV